MFQSFQIGTAFGIPIKVHWTFVVMVLFFMGSVQDGSPLGILAAILVLAGCVLLHELGHSVMAKRFGIKIIDITLWPLGGMARMNEIPENSRIEGYVAIAGPAVNFVLALLGWLAWVLVSIQGLWTLQEPIGQFIAANLMLGTFNLIPAFPMDGGRILRAWLGRNRPWVVATEMAVAVGRFCAGMMFAAALFLMMKGQGFCMLPVIPLFIWISGTRELWSVRLRHAQMQGQAGPFGVPFGAFRPGAPPTGTDTPAPDADDGPELTRDKHSGFSNADIEAMERFRGRLRRPPGE